MIEFYDVPQSDMDELAYAVDFFLTELGVEEDVDISIEYDTELGLDACCDLPDGEYDPEEGPIEIFLNPNSVDPMMRNLAHELVHVKQYVKGEMVRSPKRVTFQGNEYTVGELTYDDYRALPWEAEAFEKEETLWEAFCGIHA